MAAWDENQNRGLPIRIEGPIRITVACMIGRAGRGGGIESNHLDHAQEVVQRRDGEGKMQGGSHFVEPVYTPAMEPSGTSWNADGTRWNYRFLAPTGTRWNQVEPDGTVLEPAGTVVEPAGTRWNQMEPPVPGTGVHFSRKWLPPRKNGCPAHAVFQGPKFHYLFTDRPGTVQ